MDDARFTELMTALWGGGSPAEDLWEIAMADDGPEPAEIDPRMEARCEQSIAAAEGDLLAPPPFDGLTGIFGETSALPDRDDYRDQHPFPIDPDEEVQW